MPDGAPLIDPDIVAGRIAALLADRRCNAVKPLLAALAKLAPDHQDLLSLRVSYCCQTQAFGQALQLLDDAIGLAPEDLTLHLRRSEILFGQADYAAAAQSAAEAILHAPSLTRPKSVLGLALMKLEQYDAASACLSESFAADPGSVDVALALAALSPQHATQVLTQAIAATPRLSVLRNALTRRYLSMGNIPDAMRTARQAGADGVADTDTHCLLAFAEMQQAGWHAAASSVAQALLQAPHSRWAARLGAALASRGSGELARPAETDPTFAEQAWAAGGAILHGITRSLLLEMQCTGPVLDLFCGSGLNALTAIDICAGPWTGIEPDPGLKNLCASKTLYARLEQCAPLAFLAAGEKYSVILLNEALAYTSSLDAWFAALRNSIMPGGIALAAIPTRDPGSADLTVPAGSAGVASPAGSAGLTGHGLFAHDLGHIQQAEQDGLVLGLRYSGVLRHIEGIPLHGVIASFQLR